MAGKKVTGRAGPDADGAALPPAPPLEFVGLRPTPFQARCKARFWAAVRDDPMVDPSLLSGTDIANMLGEPSVASWFRDPAFRQYFINGDAWMSNVEWLHDLWIDRAFDILMHPLTETKDVIALGRELSKMSGRAGPAPAGDGKGEKQFTPEQARAAVEKAAKQMGWRPPETLPATASGADAEAPPETLPS